MSEEEYLNKFSIGAIPGFPEMPARFTSDAQYAIEEAVKRSRYRDGYYVYFYNGIGGYTGYALELESHPTEKEMRKLSVLELKKLDL